MILFLGDNHGTFDHIAPAIRKLAVAGAVVDGVVFLGDIEAPLPFEQCIAPICDALGHEHVYFIVGNHDSDSTSNWENLQGSSHRDIGGRVVELGGMRIAGLGGIFRGEIWNPTDDMEDADFDCYADYEKHLRNKQPFRLRDSLDVVANGRLRKHMTSIFPQQIRELAEQRADILVTHEAPNLHPHGFAALNDLALSLQVKASFHGHHHDCLAYPRHASGWQPYGVGFCGISNEQGEVIVPGDFDEATRVRREARSFSG